MVSILPERGRFKYIRQSKCQHEMVLRLLLLMENELTFKSFGIFDTKVVRQKCKYPIRFTEQSARWNYRKWFLSRNRLEKIGAQTIGVTVQARNCKRVQQKKKKLFHGVIQMGKNRLVTFFSLLFILLCVWLLTSGLCTVCYSSWLKWFLFFLFPTFLLWNLQKHPLDTRYFDRAYTREKVRWPTIERDRLKARDQAKFKEFTYTNPNVTAT